jgi:hypothetical protein
MWYATGMEELAVQEMIERGVLAVQHARQVRNLHAKRSTKGAKNRETDLQTALDRLRGAMAPIRGALAAQKPPYSERGIEQRALLLDTSDVMQRERRKLWKMQKRRKRARPCL